MATKILLVEDDRSLSEIYSLRLQAEGYQIVVANDGEQALALAIKERPGLIITDVMMPKISGFDMLDILRSTAETKDVKVIMMTALSSDDHRARGESMGANKYLVKSQVGIEDVVRTVHEVLGDSAPATGAQSTGSPAASSAAPSTPSQPTAAPAPTQPAEPATAAAQPTPAPVNDATASNTAASATPPSKMRVIQPLNNTADKIDINELLDRELAKEAGLDMFSRPQVASTEQEKTAVDQQIQQAMQPAPAPAQEPAQAQPAADTAATAAIGAPTQDDAQIPATTPAEPAAAPTQPASRPAPAVPTRDTPLQAPPRKMIPTI